MRCKFHIMDSEILWEILKFPNFEYYPAGCAILEYGAALWVSAQVSSNPDCDIQNLGIP